MSIIYIFQTFEPVSLCFENIKTIYLFSSLLPRKIPTIKYDILFRQQAIFQANSESYNGAIRDKYSWSQSIQDLDVHVKVCFNVYIYIL